VSWDATDVTRYGCGRSVWRLILRYPPNIPLKRLRISTKKRSPDSQQIGYEKQNECGGMSASSKVGPTLRYEQMLGIVNWCKCLECWYRFSLCRTVCATYLFFLCPISDNLSHVYLSMSAFGSIIVIFKIRSNHFGRRILGSRNWFQDYVERDLVGFFIDLTWLRIGSIIKICFNTVRPLSCDLIFWPSFFSLKLHVINRIVLC
jgi:hypothetical protein